MNKFVKLARKQIGVSQWKLGARWNQAPEFVDCSSFVQWLYRISGMEIPRYTWEQIRNITLRNSLEEAKAGDLLFVGSPYVRGVKTDRQSRLHVCLMTGTNTVICATNSELGYGVIEITLKDLLRTREFRAVGKPIELSPHISEHMLDENGDYITGVP